MGAVNAAKAHSSCASEALRKRACRHANYGYANGFLSDRDLHMDPTHEEMQDYADMLAVGFRPVRPNYEGVPHRPTTGVAARLAAEEAARARAQELSSHLAVQKRRAAKQREEAAFDIRAAFQERQAQRMVQRAEFHEYPHRVAARRVAHMTLNAPLASHVN